MRPVEAVLDRIAAVQERDSMNRQHLEQHSFGAERTEESLPLNEAQVTCLRREAAQGAPTDRCMGL